MSHFIGRCDTMSLDDFEDLLPDMPQDERWELIDGRVIKAKVGARWEHNAISQNIAFGLRQRLQARQAPCRVFLETFYMKNRSVESATLPDVMVSCGALPAGATSVDDPVILVEVMSSLRHYMLVDRDCPRVDVFDRVGEAWATMRRLEGLEAVLDLPALGLSLPLAEIYADVLTA